MQVYEEIRGLYDDDSAYADCSQLAHALQAAAQVLPLQHPPPRERAPWCVMVARRHVWKAENMGYDDATVVAALLHDIGWKVTAIPKAPSHPLT